MLTTNNYKFGDQTGVGALYIRPPHTDLLVIAHSLPIQIVAGNQAADSSLGSLAVTVPAAIAGGGSLSGASDPTARTARHESQWLRRPPTR